MLHREHGGMFARITVQALGNSQLVSSALILRERPAHRNVQPEAHRIEKHSKQS